MRVINICIDIDGTVTEPGDWLPLANYYFKKELEAKDITIYEIYRLLEIEEEEYNRFYEQYGEWTHKEAKIRSDVKDVINKWYDKYMIHFITAREERMRAVTLEWLEKNQIPMDSITLLGNTNKVQQAKIAGCDIFIEDRYENAIQLAEAGFEVLLIDCGYNKGDLPDKVTRVRNWEQIDHIIENRFHNISELKIAR